MKGEDGTGGHQLEVASVAKYTGAGRGADSDGARTAALAVREAQAGNVAALRDSEARSQSSAARPGPGT